MTHKIDPKRGGFPPNLSQPALRALETAGYSTLNQLTSTTEKDLLALHGMGPKGVRLLREALAEKGLSFAQAKPKK
ncbi:MAG: DNA-directed RNA polymerase subunit alpha C-terminal domain-containing protein [Anaerolineae bacterium]